MQEEEPQSTPSFCLSSLAMSAFLLTFVCFRGVGHKNVALVARLGIGFQGLFSSTLVLQGPTGPEYDYQSKADSQGGGD